MSKFVGYEACPRCISNGRDRSRDNLGRYSDGSGHCFSCGFHVFPRTVVVRKTEEVNVNEDKAVLPRDFTRQIPAAGWKWLLQYGLPYSYWKPFAGYSEYDNRLVLTFGSPVRFSIGRYLGNDTGEKGSDGKWIRRPPRKWFFWGDGHGYVEILDNSKGDSSQPVVLVEDLISAHKVSHVAPSLCLFGTNIHDLAIKTLIASKRPVTLWLDKDQHTLLPSKLNRLQAFLRHPVRHVVTEKDPKEYALDQIKEILK